MSHKQEEIGSQADVASGMERPRWLRDLLRFLPLKPQFLLSGNVRDLQLVEPTRGTITAQSLTAALATELRRAGFAQILVYDPVTGFRVHTLPGDSTDSGTALLTDVGLQPGSGGAAPAGLELFMETLPRVIARGGDPIAIIVDFASRLLIRNDVLSAGEHALFTRVLHLSHQARPRPFGHPPRPYFNTVIWIAEKEGDLPDWLVVDNHRLRHIPLAKPDHRVRRQLARTLLRSLDGYKEAEAAVVEEAESAFVESTEGLLLADMVSIAQLGRTEAVGLSSVGEAVRRFKVGISEDPWARIDRKKIRSAEEFMRRRVKGQDTAVTHTLDIVKRAMTGVGRPKRGNRPRGVVFLAGPTGVGKTELAKTLTSLLFGDDSAYIRFDMSEFSAEHADQRLIGAPPGYVGYDVGGELTNAIREKPFSVVLFDEIEKAHPRILDKFLQVLDDGVLTSGRGDRVYFSEAFIVFTSNLGIYKIGPDGERVPNVSPDDPFPTVEAKVRGEIERHFKLVLNRPEILNRIGDNILVFDFIRAPIANEIFAGMVDTILSDIAATQGIRVSLTEAALAELRSRCLADLSNGGRGIRNKVETNLVNPLARALFDSDARSGSTFEVTSFDSRNSETGAAVLKPLLKAAS